MEVAVGSIVVRCPHCNGKSFRADSGAGGLSHCNSCDGKVDLTTLLAHVGTRRIAKEAQDWGGTIHEEGQVRPNLFLGLR